MKIVMLAMATMEVPSTATTKAALAAIAAAVMTAVFTPA